MLPARSAFPPPVASIPFNGTIRTPALLVDASVPARPIPFPYGFDASNGTGQRSTALSDRERQILRCLVGGAANKTIARDLQITEATVKVHIKGLLRKIRVTNRTQAAVWGLNNKALVDEPTPAVCENHRTDHTNRHVAF